MVFYSVFLVLLISILRTIGLLLPLTIISRRAVKLSMVGFAGFLLGRLLAGLLFFGRYQYSYSSGYSYIHISNEVYAFVDLYLAMVLLMLPILPITGSAIIILFHIKQKSVVSRAIRQSDVKQRKHRAAVTVLLFTCVYLLCNIPVTVTVLWWSILTFSGGKNDILRSLETPVFTGYYIWLLTYVILVQLNAAVNPIIYLLRMRDFRGTVRLSLTKKKTYVLNTPIYKRTSHIIDMANSGLRLQTHKNFVNQQSTDSDEFSDNILPRQYIN